MALGETVADIARSPHMPTTTGIQKWRQARPEFDVAFTRAREDQMHAWADQIISFADHGTEDILRNEDGKPVLKKNGQPQLYREHIERTRLRIDTRKWLMAKILPTVFGDRINIDANHTIESKDDAEMVQELRDAMDKAGVTLDGLAEFLGQNITN